MSYIDTIKHELVGNINGLPIYHPLEATEKGDWGCYDFSCSPENLIVGGGAGEHPGLVIHNLEGLVAAHILVSIEKNLKQYPDTYVAPPDETDDYLNEILFNTGENLEFCGWSMKNVRDFVELAKSPIHNTPLLEKQEPEDWLKESIGEFIYYSLPELNPLHKEISNLPGIDKNFPGFWMRNVTCPPPNFIKSKKESLQAVGFNEHGFFRWDYKYPPKE